MFAGDVEVGSKALDRARTGIIGDSFAGPAIIRMHVEASARKFATKRRPVWIVVAMLDRSGLPHVWKLEPPVYAAVETLDHRVIIGDPTLFALVSDKVGQAHMMGGGFGPMPASKYWAVWASYLMIGLDLLVDEGHSTIGGRIQQIVVTNNGLQELGMKKSSDGMTSWQPISAGRDDVRADYREVYRRLPLPHIIEVSAGLPNAFIEGSFEEMKPRG
jgi:hypothetical protein